MNELYDGESADPIKGSDVALTRGFPKTYISERGEVFGYIGVADKDRPTMAIRCCSYKYDGKHSTDDNVATNIYGFYRLERGGIYLDSFVDEGYRALRTYKESNSCIELPISGSTYYGAVDRETRFENEAITRAMFGLTHSELSRLLEGYGLLFGLSNDYIRLPRVTRSTQSDNICDLSGDWIPKGFPYIAFSNSGYPYSHISLRAFYSYIGLLMVGKRANPIWMGLAECGVDEDILSQVTCLDDGSVGSFSNTVRYGEFND